MVEAVGEVERQQQGGGRVVEDVVRHGYVGVVTELPVRDAVVEVRNVV